MSTPAEPTRTALPAPLAPFANRVYAVVWTATVVANIGAWMYTAAAGWLMPA